MIYWVVAIIAWLVQPNNNAPLGATHDVDIRSDDSEIAAILTLQKLFCNSARQEFSTFCQFLTVSETIETLLVLGKFNRSSAQFGLTHFGVSSKWASVGSRAGRAT